MIVLDTNVVSEGTKPVPSETVMNWLAAQIPSEVFVTVVTVAEVLYGVEAVPHGKRRNLLFAAADRMFAQDFAGRVLPFDEDAARAYATIVASRNAAGRPISEFDAMIAGSRALTARP